jgi:hypothetical protein
MKARALWNQSVMAIAPIFTFTALLTITIATGRTIHMVMIQTIVAMMRQPRS